MVDQKIVNLSVILATYKRDKNLCDILAQLIKQDPQPLEIIVVDQTKEREQNTHNFIQGLIREERIKYIHQQSPHANLARNQGAKEAKGEIILFLNDDVMIGTDLIGAHFFNYADPGLAAVSGMVLENSQLPTDQLPKDYYRKHTGWIYFPLNYSRRIEVINLNSCNLSVRRDIFFAAGGFDENFIKTHLDDTDLSFRIHGICQKKHLKTIHDPKASLIHLRTPTLPGENRPSGINEFVVADRLAWMTWLYFFLINFGLRSLPEVLIRLRGCVFRKKNILNPKYLWLAFLEFIIGLKMALRLIKQGRKLKFKK